MVYGKHISFLYSVAKATKFAVDIHSKYIKEPEFADLLNILLPTCENYGRDGRSSLVVDVDDESAVGRDDEEEDEPPAPKRLRREVAALQSSPPPQPVASSSKSRATPSPGKTQPVASSSKRKRDPSISSYQPQPLPPPIPTPAAAPIQETPHTLRVDMLHEMLSNPPGGKRAAPSRHAAGPTSFVQDGLVPALYSQAPFKCHTCINSKKRCHFRGMNSSCEECHTGKHNCSIVANPTRFLQNIEELRPMMNLGPELLEGLSERIRATRPHPVLELQHLEQNPTSDIRARRTPGDPTTTNEYYVPEEPPLLTNAPSYMDLPSISGHRSSIFAGQPYVAPSAAEDRLATCIPLRARACCPIAAARVAGDLCSQPVSLVPSNAPPPRQPTPPRLVQSQLAPPRDTILSRRSQDSPRQPSAASSGVRGRPSLILRARGNSGQSGSGAA
ncbi:hypothetical protein B0H13DRAFT_1901581 [Mycena leptocephala]|nr:hypothetical protein B0H13DRAFT_1901581 [Mycena leptocephala]